MDEITRKRLRKPGDSGSWTPKECLQRALDDIESGEEKPTRCLVIFIEDPIPDGMSITPYRANLNRLEEIGYLNLHMSIQLDKWKGDGT